MARLRPNTRRSVERVTRNVSSRVASDFATTDVTKFTVCVKTTSPEGFGSRILVQAYSLPQYTSIANLDFFDDNDLAIALRIDHEDASPSECFTMVTGLARG